MNILLASAHPYIPQIAGGAQSSTHDLAMELLGRGHKVSVLAGLTGDGWLGLKSRLKLRARRAGYVVDRDLGYAVFRAWFAWDVAAEVAARADAEVVVLQSGFPVRMGLALEKTEARLVVYLRNVEIEDLGGDLRDLGKASYVANSNFTASRFSELYGLRPDVVYPLIRRESYETETTRENVTFINPHPLKGLDIALAAAERCPEIPFVFVQAWTLTGEEKARLTQRVAALGNVTLRSPTADMKSVYGRARIVLAPSQWEEAFGRVAVEAHFSGIPVVASDCGGLPEAVGPGGLLVDRKAPVDIWVSAVRRLWHDKAFYEESSAAARTYSGRPEMDRKAQIDRLLAIFQRRNVVAVRKELPKMGPDGNIVETCNDKASCLPWQPRGS